MQDVAALIARTRVSPRPYQQRIVGKALDLFVHQGRRSVLIESPTGSGKTVMALLVARALRERLGVRVGWVAMRRYLLAQAPLCRAVANPLRVRPFRTPPKQKMPCIS